MMRYLLLLGVAVWLAACEQGPSTDEGASLQPWLGSGDSSGFSRAERVRSFSFPADHGPHPGYRNEWWYITGNVADAQGREFGYQVTFFRIALSPQAPGSTSAWATNQVWMAHIALSDIRNKKHYHQQRLSRGALGLAGAQRQPHFKVWLEDWRLQADATARFPWQLSVHDKDFSLQLDLRSHKPLVLQGQQGLSQKGKDLGNASYYYSMTRLQTDGLITLDGQLYRVSGDSWLDREWGTSALDQNQAGWDWFALQFNNGEELMYYQLRQQDGTPSPTSSGKQVATDGFAAPLTSDNVVLEAVDHWRSAEGRRYPVIWRMRLPATGQHWLVKARFPAQEMSGGIVDYWEGAIEVLDEQTGQRIGKGYLEMTGY